MVSFIYCFFIIFIIVMCLFYILKLNPVQAPLRNWRGFGSLWRGHNCVQLILGWDIKVLHDQVFLLNMKSIVLIIIIFLLSYIFDIYVIVRFLRVLINLIRIWFVVPSAGMRFVPLWDGVGGVGMVGHQHHSLVVIEIILVYLTYCVLRWFGVPPMTFGCVIVCILLLYPFNWFIQILPKFFKTFSSFSKDIGNVNSRVISHCPAWHLGKFWR